MTDFDLIINASESDQIKKLLTENGYEWDEARNEFFSPNGIALHFIIAGMVCRLSRKIDLKRRVRQFSPMKRLNMSLR